MNVDVIIVLFGGIGLFLLGMHLMTDGLKMAAGKALHHVLEHSTNTPFRAIASGALITSLVQSSSAVTVATIGFVNAGLLKLKQAVLVIYGSNVGTTMTGWLVALLGFHVDIQAMALPAIGLGMFMKLLARSERLAAYGMALAGFGLLFLGIAFLKSAFTGLESSVDLQAMAGDGVVNVLMFLGVGFVMTLLMQSSSAAMALTLTAAGSGWIPLESAAAMVIGSNLGTTSTAVIAAIGATSSAKRVAASHVFFNLITGVVALLTLPVWLWLVSQAGSMMQGNDHVATVLALFHTVFNVLGVFIMLPITNRLVAYLETLFRQAEEDESRPRYLDLTLVDTPELAHKALGHELQRVAMLVRAMATDAINTESSLSARLKQELAVVIKLVEAIGAFIVRLRQVALPEYLSPSFTHALASARYMIDVAEAAYQIDKAQSGALIELTPEIEQAINEYRKYAVSGLTLSVAEAGAWDDEARKAYIVKLEALYMVLKMQLLHQGTVGHVPVRHVVAMIDLLKITGKMVKEMIKATQALSDFISLAEIKPLGTESMDEVIEDGEHENQHA